MIDREGNAIVIEPQTDSRRGWVLNPSLRQHEISFLRLIRSPRNFIPTLFVLRECLDLFILHPKEFVKLGLFLSAAGPKTVALLEG